MDRLKTYCSFVSWKVTKVGSRGLQRGSASGLLKLRLAYSVRTPPVCRKNQCVFFSDLLFKLTLFHERSTQAGKHSHHVHGSEAHLPRMTGKKAFSTSMTG